MCVAMVIIHTKTLEKKGVDDVTTKEPTLELRQPLTMSQGTALFSCGVMEAGRWPDVSRGFCFRQRPHNSSPESLWDVTPEDAPGPLLPPPETSATGGISGLLRGLSLSEAASASSPGSAAPPSKRQCRSLSCSDELSACRSQWRPQSSRVWVPVEKRRCHSGGSVPRGAASVASASSSASAFGLPGMQRSSSFSFPTRYDPMEPPDFSQTLSIFPAVLPGSGSGSGPCPVYLSHEQICPADTAGAPSEASSPDSTPEMDRRAAQGGLARSRSQPCVLNEKKIGVKRRRPADTHKQRPSLDLAKMTQKQTFQSLSCPGFTGDDRCPSSRTPPSFRSPTNQSERLPSARDRADEPGLSPKHDESDLDFPGYGDWTTNGKEREPQWVGLCGQRRDVLGGELDIEQIERN